MNTKILAIVLIAICMVHLSVQDDAAKDTKKADAAKPAAKPAATTTSTPASTTTVPVTTYAAPYYGGWPVDWNHDGIIDWRDGWGLGGGYNTRVVEPYGWNNGWRGAWDRNGDGIVDWRDRAWGWNGGYAEPVVRRLGARSDTLANLKTQMLVSNASRVLADHISYFIQDGKISDEELAFQLFDKNSDGFLSAQELYDGLKLVGEDVKLEDIEMAFAYLGAKDGKINLEMFQKLAEMGKQQ